MTTTVRGKHGKMIVRGSFEKAKAFYCSYFKCTDEDISAIWVKKDKPRAYNVPELKN